MARAYVGIVTPRGLEQFHEEEDHTARFMQRRLQRRSQWSAYCMWFVVAENDARVLTRLVETCCFEAAWSLICERAQDRGVLLPDHEFCEAPA